MDYLSFCFVYHSRIEQQIATLRSKIAYLYYVKRFVGYSGVLFNDFHIDCSRASKDKDR